MDGYENPTRNQTPNEVYRLSWLAYVGVTFRFLVLAAVSAGVASLALTRAQSGQAQQIGMAISVVLLLGALAMFVYQVLVRRSVRLYFDDSGVWLYRGILPWSRGARGVKWRDIEDAQYFMGFFSWVFRSYSVRVGHRFTKTSEIFVRHLGRGNKAVEEINRVHQVLLKGEHGTEVSIERPVG